MPKTDNTDFITYLSNKAELDFETLKDLFDKNINPFDVAFELIQNHNVDATQLGRIWGDYLGFAYVNPNFTIVNQDYFNLLGIDFINGNKAIPLYKLGRAITVTTCYPTNPYIQDKLEKKLNAIVSLVFCFPFDIETYLLST